MRASQACRVCSQRVDPFGSAACVNHDKPLSAECREEEAVDEAEMSAEEFQRKQAFKSQLLEQACQRPVCMCCIRQTAHGSSSCGPDLDSHSRLHRAALQVVVDLRQR